jgi:anti-sigma factor RsiW
MNCDQAEELLFESYDVELKFRAADVSSETLQRHLATCDACSELAAQLRVVDARLSAVLRPITAPASIAAGVRRHQRQERQARVRESLPDIIHLAGCGAATLLSALLLPVEISLTISVGITFTGLTYMALALMRSSLDAAEQTDW